jgi:O-antigen/teichoic acid export membrane protein
MKFLIALPMRIWRALRFHPHDASTEDGRSRERYRRVALSSAAAFSGRAIALLSTLITVPLTYRYLGAERYGLWMVLVSFITAMGIADLGIGNGVANAIAEAYGQDDRQQMREYAASGFFLMLGIGALLAVTGAVAYPHVPWTRLLNVKSVAVAQEGARAFLVLFIWFVLNVPLSVIPRIQFGLQRAYWSQVVAACGNILSLLGLIVVIELHGNLTWLVFASTFGVIAATLANGCILFRGAPWLFPLPKSYRPVAAAKILRMGLMFFMLQCAGVLGFTSDNIVITQLLGAASVPVYAVPQKLFAISTQLLVIGMLPMWPAYGEAFARRDFVWVQKTFWGSVRTTLSVIVPLCVFLAASGPWIIRVVVGKSLHVPIALFWTLAAWGVIQAGWVPMSILLNGVGSLRLRAPVTVFSNLVNLALSIYLTRRVGVMGVCLGSIIAQVTIVIPVCAFLIHKLFKSMDDGKISFESRGASTEFSVP